MQILNKTTNQLILLPKYNKTQVYSLLNVSMVFLYLSLRYLNRYWANQLGIFITTSTKTAIFIATHLKKHYMAYHYQQDCPSFDIKRHERLSAN